MCGIVGYIGPRVAQDFLLEGLRRLEYRGYDSAGTATLDENNQTGVNLDSENFRLEAEKVMGIKGGTDDEDIAGESDAETKATTSEDPNASTENN